jgi:hypothetical protein
MEKEKNAPPEKEKTEKKSKIQVASGFRRFKSLLFVRDFLSFS